MRQLVIEALGQLLCNSGFSLQFLIVTFQFLTQLTAMKDLDHHNSHDLETCGFILGVSDTRGLSSNVFVLASNRTRWKLQGSFVQKDHATPSQQSDHGERYPPHVYLGLCSASWGV